MQNAVFGFPLLCVIGSLFWRRGASPNHRPAPPPPEESPWELANRLVFESHHRWSLVLDDDFQPVNVVDESRLSKTVGS